MKRDLHFVALAPLLAACAVLICFLSCTDLGLPPSPETHIEPFLTVDNIIVGEGSVGTFTVSMSEATDVDVTFSYQLVDGLATGGNDFQPASGSRTIRAGNLSTTITVTTFTDFQVEGDETFDLKLSNPINAVFTDSIGIATISGATLPILSVEDLTIPEGSSASVQVTTSSQSGVNITFNWQLVSGSAAAGSDFVGGSGTATIIAGTLSTGIPIQVNPDATTEGDETFDVVLTSPTNALIGDGTGLITIPANIAPVSFATTIRPLITGNCAVAGCHGGGASDGGLAMGAATYNQVRNATGAHGAIISNPPSSSTSSLYLVLTASPPSGIARMPNGGPFFSPAQQQAIKDWIDQGALNN